MQNDKVAGLLAAKKAAANGAGAGAPAAPAAGGVAPAAGKITIKKLSAVKPSTEVKTEAAASTTAAATEVAEAAEAKTEAAEPVASAAVQQDLPAVNPIEEGKAQPRAAKKTATAPASTDLRDQFAGQIAAALVSRESSNLSSPTACDSVAGMAYEVADAMLKARGK